MVELGKYATTVLTAYGAAITVLVVLVVVSVHRGRRVRAEMESVERKVRGNG